MTVDHDTLASLEIGLGNVGSAAGKVSLLETRLEHRARSASFSWLDDLASVAQRCQLELPVVRRVISNLGWQAREAGTGLARPRR
jgi:hypothetical protein